MNQQSVLSHGAPIHGSQNLPVHAPEHLIGRAADQDSIHLALKARTAVLLYGPSGIGKTSLLATLAADYAELPGGVLWLESANDSLLALLNRVARAYGLAGWNSDSRDEAQTQVRQLLEENRPLVVLDGEIELAAAREFTRECAAGIPLLLTYPHIAAGPWTPVQLSDLNESDARTLLDQLAPELLDTDADAAARLMTLVGGHPFSIEIAGLAIAYADDLVAYLGRIPELPPGQTNRAMATVMAAYRLLSSELQGMVMLLGTTFAGGASEELLADVTGASAGTIRTRMRELVARGLAIERNVADQPYFVAHELMHRFAHSFLRGKRRLDTMRARHLHGLPVYIRRNTDARLYDRLAAEMDNVLAAGRYAAERGKIDVLADLVQLLAPVDAQSFVTACGFQPEYDWLNYIKEHPAAAQAGLLDYVVPELPEPAEEEAPLSAVEAEISPAEEPVEALETPVADEVAQPEPELDLPEPTEPPVETDALTVEGSQTPSEPPGLPGVDSLLEPVESVAEYASDISSSEQFEEEVQPTSGEDDGSDQAEPISPPPADQPEPQPIADSDPEAAIAQYAEALDGYHANGNIDDEMAALQALAALSLESANYEDVLNYVDKGLQLAQEVDNPQREGQMLIVLGDLQLSLGRLDGAEVAYMEAIEALRPTEDWLGIGLTLDKLGSVYWEQQRSDAAVEVWTQTIPIFDRLKRPDLACDTLDKIGDTQAEQQQPEAAQATHQRAYVLARANGDAQRAFEQAEKLGLLAESIGDRDHTLLHYRQALHFAFVLNNPVDLGQTLLGVARLLIDDTVNLHRSLQLLEAASELLPDDTEVQRLLSRAKIRQERLLKAGVTLPIGEESLADYALGAVDA